MKAFVHYNARSIKEAIGLLSRYRGNAKVNAGGTDLISALKDKVLPTYPEAVINIKTIKALSYIRNNRKGLRIGALTTLAEIAESLEINRDYKLLADAARFVASPNVRNMATVGGNLAQDVRCWYYRYPRQIGGPIICLRKGGHICSALLGENRYHSIFGAAPLENYPCSENCPGHVDIPSYLNELNRGEYKKAAEILLDSNPFPAITGRVCPVYCEPNCNRKGLDDPVGVQCIERAIGDYILDKAEEFYKVPDSVTKKAIAIVGSGPAGLAAAFYLRRHGHSITVYERLPEAGGMLLYSIPPFRLPKEVVRRQTKALKNMGITFKTGVEVGKDVTIEDLKSQFDAVFFAGGTWNAFKLGVPGEKSQNIYYALEYLKEVNLGEKRPLGERVIVVGGGSVAIDAARTAKRLGARDVHVVCLETRDLGSKDRMLALDQEIMDAEAEGIKIHPSLGIKEIITENGRAKGIMTIKCLSVWEPDGRFNPQYDYSITSTMEMDGLIIAIGQGAEPALFSTIKGDEDSLFIGGDFKTGPSTVIKAIASAREAVDAIQRYLRQEKDKAKDEARTHFVESTFADTPRIKVKRPSVLERVNDINVEDVYSIDTIDMEKEASRCFNCGCVAVEPSDLAVALACLDAVIVTTTREIRARDLFHATALSSTTLRPEELIKEVKIPKPPAGTIQRFEKFTIRSPIDFSIVSIAVLLSMKDGVCKNARIVLGALAPEPVYLEEAEEALVGRRITPEIAEDVAQLALKGAFPLSQNGYKIEIAKALIKRAILASQ